MQTMQVWKLQKKKNNPKKQNKPTIFKNKKTKTPKNLELYISCIQEYHY